MERYPWEAVYNNVLGSRVVMEAAVGFGVERFVLVSTDKAVRPANVMGASKRAAELLMQSLQGNGTRFMAVRFGNVVGSSGSVVPLFRRQIERGGPVTVTHPDATRYFMTIPEAAQLILQAAAMGRGGEIFILKMGTPVRIADMARDLIRLSGKEPDRDVRIVFTGLREGEKLTEELITDGEDVVATPHEEIMVLQTNGIDPAELRRNLAGPLEALCRAAETHDREGIVRALRRMVPEYDPARGFRHRD
jgi:FlaA1/EpsC-like NDP-sugar epimerase